MHSKESSRPRTNHIYNEIDESLSNKLNKCSYMNKSYSRINCPWPNPPTLGLLVNGWSSLIHSPSETRSSGPGGIILITSCYWQ